MKGTTVGRSVTLELSVKCVLTLLLRPVQLLVGYNDAFQTREGFTGGLIVKNSWSDGPTQGSHSLAYWMQEVSDWEERTVCPNSWKCVTRPSMRTVRVWTD